MQFGMIHYRAPGNTLEEFLDYVAETGFDVVELQCQDVWPEGNDLPEREAERIRGLFEERSIEVSALSTGNDFLAVGEDAIRNQVERMDRLSKLAGILGTKILRTEGGSRNDQVPEEKEGETIGECIKRCLAFTERDDTYMAVDNHGHVTNNPDTLLTALAIADSPRAGLRNVVPFMTGWPHTHCTLTSRIAREPARGERTQARYMVKAKLISSTQSLHFPGLDTRGPTSPSGKGLQTRITPSPMPTA